MKEIASCIAGAFSNYAASALSVAWRHLSAPAPKPEGRSSQAVFKLRLATKIVRTQSWMPLFRLAIQLTIKMQYNALTTPLSKVFDTNTHKTAATARPTSPPATCQNPPSGTFKLKTGPSTYLQASTRGFGTASGFHSTSNPAAATIFFVHSSTKQLGFYPSRGVHALTVQLIRSEYYQPISFRASTATSLPYAHPVTVGVNADCRLQFSNEEYGSSVLQDCGEGPVLYPPFLAALNPASCKSVGIRFTRA